MILDQSRPGADANRAARESRCANDVNEYLLKLHQRMRATGFPADDPLYLKVGMALEAMRAVAMDMHRREHSDKVELGPKTK